MNHTCGTREGQAYCSGNDGIGQLGNGTTTTSHLNTPALVNLAALLHARSISAGDAHTCAIVDRGVGYGALYCWGANASGQLGLGDNAARTAPVQVGAQADWSTVTARTNSTCAVRAGRLYCWGANSYGQLGLGDTGARNAPEQVGVATDWIEVQDGNRQICGRRGGEAYCWGANSYGQLGLGDASSRSTPVRVGAQSDWLQVATGHVHSCGLRGGAAGGTLWCWGYNGYYNLGFSPAGNYDQPTQVTALGTGASWQRVAPGRENWTCGIWAGQLYCWGGNYGGCLGTDGTANVSTPTQVAGGGTDWSDVRTGVQHTCGLRSGALYCWGTNSSGQVGNASTTQANSPVAITAPTSP